MGDPYSVEARRLLNLGAKGIVAADKKQEYETTIARLKQEGWVPNKTPKQARQEEVR